MGEKVAVVTLGCAKNLVDSEVILGSLAAEGFETSDSLEDAETIIVNTCGFIGPAKEESIQAIIQAAESKRAGRASRLVVAGCLSERYRDELARELPEVDLFVGVNHHALLGALLKQGVRGQHFGSPIDYELVSRKRLRSTPRHVAYLKVSEGCSLKCSFCIIPAIRGPQRSRPIDQLLREAEELARDGTRELILIAQDLTSYGRDLGRDVNLSRLLKQLAKVDGLLWIRLLYLYPQHVTWELVETVASEEKVVNYLDIPLQHADGKILRRMNRPGNYRSLHRLCRGLRERIPGVALRTTFIVGFPGETDQAFEDLLRLVEEVRFEALGAFRFSPEEGTPAYNLRPRVPARLVEERFRRLMETQARISLERNRTLVGSRVTLIVDGPGEAPFTLVGRLPTQAPEVDGLLLLKGPDVQPGEIVQATVTGAHPYHLEGKVETGAC